MKRLIVALLALAIVAVLIVMLRDEAGRGQPPATGKPPGPAVAPTPSLAVTLAPPTPAPLSTEPPFEGIEELNAAGRTVHDDLALLNQVFLSWQTNFPAEGNPVGSNADITAALIGRNRLRYALVPPRHPAINSAGELVDRWGTPYFFHQLDGRSMEIRSAGPDRRLYTEDDSVVTP
jgi:hypothetical protein